MRKTLPFLAALGIAAVFASGCANVENKFGRGMANTFEVVRMGEFRRTMEQSALFDSPDYAYSTGFVHGMDRSIERTGIGVYEMVTAPFPPYHPICTDQFAPGPVYPDAYTPGIIADSLFATDDELGYSGGDVAPFLPGCTFRIFDMH